MNIRDTSGERWRFQPVLAVHSEIEAMASERMPDYVFHLHDGVSVEPINEIVTALDLAEAKTLAEMRLLLSADFTHVEVYEGAKLAFSLSRDSLR